MAAIAAGVVAHTENLLVRTTSSAALKVGFAEIFLMAQTVPPHEEGTGLPQFTFPINSGHNLPFHQSK
jgi:hypothetical protein